MGRIIYAEDKGYTDRQKNLDAFMGILNPDEEKGAVGIYHGTELKSVIKVVDNSRVTGAGSGCSSQVRPTLLEFFLDIEYVFKKSVSPVLYEKMYHHYILGDTEETFEPKELNEQIQAVGENFISFQIWPVRCYFSTTKNGRLRQTIRL
jgi:hypothetical protein